MAPNIQPFDGPVGAVVTAVDLSQPMDAADFKTLLDAWNAQIARFAKNGSTGSEYLKTGSRGWMRNFQRTPPPRVANCDTGVRHGTRAPCLAEHREPRGCQRRAPQTQPAAPPARVQARAKGRARREVAAECGAAPQPRAPARELEGRAAARGNDAAPRPGRDCEVPGRGGAERGQGFLAFTVSAIFFGMTN